MAGREDTELAALHLINIFVIFFLLASFFNRRGVHGVHFGGGAGGAVCLHGRGLKPVSGHRDTGTVNRAQTPMKGERIAEVCSGWVRLCQVRS